MTQEELDALMSEGDSGLQEIDSLDSQADADSLQAGEEADIAGAQTDMQTGVETGAEIDAEANTDSEADKEAGEAAFVPSGFRVHATKSWPPPPPDKEHKVVHQLDDVTRDTEVKAGEVFDQLDIISSNAESIVKSAKKMKEYFATQEELFTKLTEHFSHVESFKRALESTQAMRKELAEITDNANNCLDAMLQAMDIMQFQDINRQRIERVINVMRALAQYMNSLFESKIEDSKRVASAVYIPGDGNPGIADAEDIENLIASFGQKK